MNTSRSIYRRCVNAISSNTLKVQGYTPRIWGSPSANRGALLLIGTGVDIWRVGWQRPNVVIAQEPKITTPQMYRPIKSQVEAIVKLLMGIMLTMNVSTIAGHRMILEQVEVHLPASHPSILVVGHAVWNDNIDLHETGFNLSYDIFKRFFKSMQTTAERTWGSDAAATLQNVPYQRALIPQSNPDKRDWSKTCLPSIWNSQELCK